MKSGFAAVRYSAAEGLLSTLYRPSESGVSTLEDVRFDGRNRLERVLAEMRMLEGAPLALVVGGQPICVLIREHYWNHSVTAS